MERLAVSAQSINKLNDSGFRISVNISL